MGWDGIEDEEKLSHINVGILTFLLTDDLTHLVEV